MLNRRLSVSLKRISWWFRTSQDQNVTGRECAPFILSCLLLRETKIATIHPLLILMYVELLNVQVKGQSRVGACVSDGELRLQVTGPVALLAGSLGSELHHGAPCHFPCRSGEDPGVHPAAVWEGGRERPALSYLQGQLERLDPLPRRPGSPPRSLPRLTGSPLKPSQEGVCGSGFHARRERLALEPWPPPQQGDGPRIPGDILSHQAEEGSHPRPPQVPAAVGGSIPPSVRLPC